MTTANYTRSTQLANRDAAIARGYQVVRYRKAELILEWFAGIGIALCAWFALACFLAI